MNFYMRFTRMMTLSAHHLTERSDAKSKKSLHLSRAVEGARLKGSYL